MAVKKLLLKASWVGLLLGFLGTAHAVPDASSSSKSGKKGIAVLPFVALEEETPQWLVRGIEAHLRNNLRDLRWARVPLEEEVTRCLEQSGIALTQRIEAGKLNLLREKLAADAALFGAVMQRGSKIVIKMKVLNLDRSKSVKEFEQKGTAANLNLLLQESTALLAAACGVAVTPEDRAWMVAPADFKTADLQQLAETALFMEREDFKNAAQICEEILLKHPRNVAAVLAAAEAYRGLRRLDKVERVLREGAARVPHSVSLQLELAECYLDQGQIDEAKKKVDSLMAFHPREPHALWILARVYQEKGLKDLALDTLEQGISLSAEKDRFYALMGAIQQDKGNLDEALNLCDKALKENPSNREAIKRKGILLGLTGRYDQAVELYSKGITSADALSPQKARVTGRSAVEEYEEAVRRDPGNAAAYNAMGAAYVQEGKWIEALAAYRRALQINPQFAPAYFNMAEVHVKQGKVEEAILCYQKSLAVHPRHRESYLNLASVYASAGKPGSAAKILEKGGELFPADPDIASGLMDLYARKGAWKKVWRRAEETQKASGIPGQAALLTAQAYERQGKTKKAKAFYERSRKENPKLWAKQQ